jgi:hypothetical protein
MPTFATGVAKQVAIAAEVTEGVNPVTGGKYLRRVSSDLAMNKDTYESQEILVSQQIRDARHGVHRPQGTFAGQVSPGSFNDFWEGILRNNFIAGSSMGPSSLDLDPVAGTLTLTGGGLLAAGFKRHDVFRVTGAGAPNIAINNANLRITDLTDTVITSRDIPKITGLTAGSLAGITVKVVGKKVFMPPIGALYKSFSIEHYFSDIGQSELFVGCKFGQTSIALPATGLVTFSSQVIGMDMVQSPTQQLTAPAPTTTSTSLAAVNGLVEYNDQDVAIITGMNIQLNGALGADPVVGSNIVPHIFQGRFRVTGNMTALFMDETMFNTFLNETEVGVTLMLTMGSGPNADFMNFMMPRVKLMGSTKSDSDMALIQTFNFSALENVTFEPNGDMSTFVIQDSLA